MTIKVPANLILWGEYFVLTGSPAITAAVEPYCTLQFRPSERFVLESRFGSGDEGGNEKFLYYFGGNYFFFKIIEKVFFKHYPPARQLPSVHVTLDSSQFYNKAGRKLGLGSSAASAVAYMCFLSFIFNECEPAKEKICEMTKEAHSLIQGKKGSGYDIFSSIYGGIQSYHLEQNLVDMRKLQSPVGRDFLIFNRDQSVRTDKAILNFDDWKNRNINDYIVMENRYKQLYDELFRKLFSEKQNSSPDSEDLMKTLRELKTLYAHLGREIGRPAEIKELDDCADILFYKCLGAGNEIAWCKTRGNLCEFDNKIPLSLCTKGLHWLK